MAWKSNLIYVSAGILVGVALTLYMREPEYIKVDKIHNRDRVITKIVERPDGSKTTEIIKDSSKTEIHREVKSLKKDWTVGVISSVTGPVPAYGVMVSRRIIGDIFVGGYVKTDLEAGLTITYTF